MEISIIGASGKIGKAVSSILSREKYIQQINLISREKSIKTLEGHKLDIYDSLAAEGLDVEISVYSDKDISCVCNSDIVIIPAGVPRTGTMTRLDLSKKNASIIKKYAKEIGKQCDTKLFIITNPVDVMTQKALVESGYERNQVFGLGTHLDSMRFKVAIAKYFKVHIGDVRTRIIGEHGDSMVPLFSATAIGGIPINRLPEYKTFPHNEIIDFVKNGGKKIIELKGGSEYGPASAILNVVRSIANDTKRYLTLSSYVNGEIDNICDVCIGVPVVVGKKGVEKIIPIELEKNELEQFINSVNIVKKYYEEIKDI